jgi:predicted amidohydrolase YtcJ
MQRVLTNGRIFDGERILDGHVALLEGAAVAAVLPIDKTPAGAERVDLDGGLLAPGFIDVQVNGGGVLFNDQPSVEGIRASAKPTGATAPPACCRPWSATTGRSWNAAPVPSRRPWKTVCSGFGASTWKAPTSTPRARVFMTKR